MSKQDECWTCGRPFNDDKYKIVRTYVEMPHGRQELIDQACIPCVIKGNRPGCNKETLDSIS